MTNPFLKAAYDMGAAQAVKEAGVRLRDLLEIATYNTLHPATLLGAGAGATMAGEDNRLAGALAGAVGGRAGMVLGEKAIGRMTRPRVDLSTSRYMDKLKAVQSGGAENFEERMRAALKGFPEEAVRHAERNSMNRGLRSMQALRDAHANRQSAGALAGMVAGGAGGGALVGEHAERSQGSLDKLRDLVESYSQERS
jgi:hypothetical protein